MWMSKRMSWIFTMFIFCLLLGCGNASQPTAASSNGATSGDTAADSQPANNTMSKPEQTPGESPESVVLTVVTAWDASLSSHLKGLEMLQEKVEQKSNGRLKIESKGGPEVIPPFELGQAVQNGVTDMAHISAAYYAQQVPEALALDYSTLSPEEERNRGSIEYLSEIHQQKMDVHYLGRSPGFQYNFYTKKQITSVSDLKGSRLRVAPLYLPLVQAVGASPINMPVGEIYQALERNVIDGIGYPSESIASLGLDDVLKYKIKPSFYQIDSSFIVNLEKWNSLSADLQQILTESVQEVEKEYPALCLEFEKAEEEQLIAKDFEIVELTDAKEFLATANQAGWEWIQANSPEHGEELKRLFTD